MLEMNGGNSVATGPRPLEKIEREITELEGEIAGLLKGLVG